MRRLPWPVAEQVVIFAFILCPASALSQAVPGLPTFSTMDQRQFDSINVANLNIFVNIPLRDKQGPLQPSYSLTDNSLATIISGRWSVPAANGF